MREGGGKRARQTEGIRQQRHDSLREDAEEGKGREQNRDKKR